MQWKIAVLCCIPIIAEGAVIFETLGDLPGGSLNSCANGISRDGLIVVGYGTDAEESKAFMWDSVSGMVILTLPDGGDGDFSVANDVSNDGSTIVGWGIHRIPGIFTEAIHWDAEQGSTWLGHLTTSTYPLTGVAHAVNGDGSVVVGSTGYYSGMWLTGDQAFRWDAENGLVRLGDLGGKEKLSSALDVSEDGHIIVGYSVSPTGNEAFRWDELNGMVGLGDLTDGAHSLRMSTYNASGDGGLGSGSTYSTPTFIELSKATSISSDGGIIVGRARSSRGYEAFMWDTTNGMIGLGDIHETADSEAMDVSADGSIIVGRGKGEVALIWTRENSYVPVSLDALLDANNIVYRDFKYSSANAVSDDGTIIVGQVTYENLDREAFILNLNALEPQYWGGYGFANEFGDINTDDWMGWLTVNQAPYIWSYSLNSWLYMEEPASDAAGAWAYFFK